MLSRFEMLLFFEYFKFILKIGGRNFETDEKQYIMKSEVHEVQNNLRNISGSFVVWK